MNQSENIAELATALSIAQGQMTHAIKDSVNPHFKSNYADLASVWEAVRKPLADNGLCIMQTTDGSNLITTLAHKSGQWIKSITPIFNGRNDAQGFGSGLTYARRYALAGIAGVAQDDDDANDAQPPKAQPKPQAQTPKPQAPAQQQKPQITPQAQARKEKLDQLMRDTITVRLTAEMVEGIVGKDINTATNEQLKALHDLVEELKTNPKKEG